MECEERHQLGSSDFELSIPHQKKSTALGCEVMSHCTRGSRARHMRSLELPYLTRYLSVLDEQGTVGKLGTSAMRQHSEQGAKKPHPVTK